MRIEIVQMNGESKGKWRLDRSGQFSVKSAYNFLVDIAPQDSRCWQDIWNIKIPQRCKLQMWVILHNRLITNAALYDRHMDPDGLCETCSD